MTERPETLTVDEVAGILRINPDTVRRMLRERRLPGIRLGKAWRIVRGDLDDYLQRGRLQPDGMGANDRTARSG